jgi:hypothetical protein
MLVSSRTANYHPNRKHWRRTVRKGTRKPAGPAASNDERAQLPIAPETSDPKYLAALIEGITDENRHALANTGHAVGQEFW